MKSEEENVHNHHGKGVLSTVLKFKKCLCKKSGAPTNAVTIQPNGRLLIGTGRFIDFDTEMDEMLLKLLDISLLAVQERLNMLEKIQQPIAII